MTRQTQPRREDHLIDPIESVERASDDRAIANDDSHDDPGTTESDDGIEDAEDVSEVS